MPSAPWPGTRTSDGVPVALARVLVSGCVRATMTYAGCLVGAPHVWTRWTEGEALYLKAMHAVLGTPTGHATALAAELAVPLLPDFFAEEAAAMVARVWCLPSSSLLWQAWRAARVLHDRRVVATSLTYGRQPRAARC